MAAAIPFIMLAGTAVGAASQIQQGQQQKQMAAEEARQMQEQAKNEYATSQIQAMEDRRQSQLAQSRAQAVAAASGADATSNSFVRNISDMEGQGELNALTSLWGGSERMRQLNNQASMTKYSGQQSAKAANIGAVSSLIQGGSSLYQKYGGKPKSA